ncbi:MAG: sugar phosphate nucleotidyltransferase [Candidatus Neomarinimicrobiota bacterium]|nr:sugar phosphate nucleotidyltransferase [Candidatus Neomarinimicrobiota bacterium]
MNDMTLLVMAAGMGSRYGGLKQLDEVGPSGETIIDYSVFDAIEAGFSKVVFIIRRDFEDEFKTKISNKFSNDIQVEFVFQDIHQLPSGFSLPEDRIKPWGTGHAILCASNFIDGPFNAINADDYYGRESFKTIADYYNNGNDSFSMVAFQLEKTLSDFGSVTRGLCTVNNDKLINVAETENLVKSKSGIRSNSDLDLNGNEPVSMNMWGFTPAIFDYLNEMFEVFLSKNIHDIKSEFLIPSVINDLINSGDELVQVLYSKSSWFGVTFKEDKSYVVQQIQNLVNSGFYPHKLFPLK